ncbi:MAG: VPLPA-CTERM sorting domain-containing protein, partial [Gammaproteobacteria bacterium]|nr:VPLPA-CTERM sorting domain-containing protein [Gammaproteobacteria bacterium]
QAGDLVLGADGNLQVQPVPLPATAWLLGSAIVGMATLRRRNNAAA